jgi:hypothetical protein
MEKASNQNKFPESESMGDVFKAFFPKFPQFLRLFPSKLLKISKRFSFPSLQGFGTPSPTREIISHI